MLQSNDLSIAQNKSVFNCVFKFSYITGKSIFSQHVQYIRGDRSNSLFSLFLKLFYQPHYKDIFIAWCRFGRAICQAEVEWKNAHFLLENGIDTYKPISFGWQSRLGLEKKSFFITEKLAADPLDEFVAQRWGQFCEKEKEKLITALGKFLRKIHDMKISLPDLYLWHIFVSQTEHGDWRFAVIDLHRMKTDVTNSEEYLKNLGRFHYSMIDRYFDDKSRRLLISSYAGDSWPENTESLYARVVKYSAVISKRRRANQY